MIHHTNPCDCDQVLLPSSILPTPEQVLHQAIDMIQASVEERTKAVQAAMAQLNEVLDLLESYEEALGRLVVEDKPGREVREPTPKPKRRRASDALRSPLGLTPNGQTVYDALPKDGSKIGLRELSARTGLGSQPVGVVASHLARQHPHLVERMGVSVYRRAKGDKVKS